MKSIKELEKDYTINLDNEEIEILQDLENNKFKSATKERENFLKVQ